MYPHFLVGLLDMSIAQGRKGERYTHTEVETQMSKLHSMFTSDKASRLSGSVTHHTEAPLKPPREE